MLSLCFCQSLLILDEEFGIAYRFTSREDNQRLESQVNAHLLIDDWQRFDVLLYQHGYHVAVRAILGNRYRRGFAVFGQRSRPVDIQGSIHFGKGEGFSIPPKRVSRIGCRLSIASLLEDWVFSASLKEVLECPIEMSQGLLYRHTGDMRKPGVLFLEARQHGREMGIEKLLSMFRIGNRAGIESPVVDEATTSERLRKDTLLFVGPVEPICVRSLRLAHLLAFLISLDMLFHRGQDLSIERPIVLFCDFLHLLQYANREPDGERFCCFLFFFHTAIIRLNWACVYRHRTPPQKERAFYPMPKARGFTARVDKKEKSL